MTFRLSFVALLVAAIIVATACKKNKTPESPVSNSSTQDTFKWWGGPLAGDYIYFQLNGPAKTAYWDFGDGAVFTPSNDDVYSPVWHKYSHVGTYTVSLVRDGNTAGTIKKVITLQPNYNFVSEGVPVVGDTFRFTFRAYLPPGNSYLWTFGDGTSSTDSIPPPHVYTTPGNKTVRVVVNGDNNTWFYTYFTILADPLYTADVAKAHNWFDGKDPGITFVNKLTLKMNYQEIGYNAYASNNDALYFVSRYADDTIYYNHAKDSIIVHLVHQTGGAGTPPVTVHTYYHTI